MRSFLRGAVEVHILHHAAEREVHGAWLAAELARHGHAISSGTLYPMLHRMHQAGLLDRHGRVAAGRRLRCYTATPAGWEALTAARVPRCGSSPARSSPARHYLAGRARPEREQTHDHRRHR